MSISNGKTKISELLFRQFMDRALIVASRGHRLSSENKNGPNWLFEKILNLFRASFLASGPAGPGDQLLQDGSGRMAGPERKILLDCDAGPGASQSASVGNEPRSGPHSRAPAAARTKNIFTLRSARGVKNDRHDCSQCEWERDPGPGRALALTSGHCSLECEPRGRALVTCRGHIAEFLDMRERR